MSASPVLHRDRYARICGVAMNWKALQILNHLYLLTLVGSMLSIFTLRLLASATSQQVDFIGEYRTSIERATRNCLKARAVALTLESNTGRTLPLIRNGDVVSIRDPSLLIRPTVEEANQLIRALSAFPRRCGEMPVSQIRRHLRTLKQVESDSAKLLARLVTATDGAQTDGRTLAYPTPSCRRLIQGELF